MPCPQNNLHLHYVHVHTPSTKQFRHCLVPFAMCACEYFAMWNGSIFFIYQKEKIATKHMLDHRNLQFPRYWNKRWQIVFQYTMTTARSTGSEEPLQQHSTNDGNTTVEKTRTNLNSNTKQLMHTKAALCQKSIQMNRWTNTCTTGFIWASCSNHWFYKHMHMKQCKSSKTYCMPNVSDQTVQPCRHIHLMLIQPLRCKELEKNFCT